MEYLSDCSVSLYGNDDDVDVFASCLCFYLQLYEYTVGLYCDGAGVGIHYMGLFLLVDSPDTPAPFLFTYFIIQTLYSSIHTYLHTLNTYIQPSSAVVLKWNSVFRTIQFQFSFVRRWISF